MNSGNIILSEISQAQKKKYCMISPLCGIKKKKKKKSNLNFSGSPVVKTLVSEVVPAAGCDPKQTKNVKLIVSFRDCGSFHNLDHSDSIMDVHISQNVSNCTFKNKNLQATPLCSGLSASSAKLSDNN